jgi:periplasmic copper chaperone A
MRTTITGLLSFIIMLALAIPAAAQDGPGMPPADDNGGFDIAFSGVWFNTETGVVHLTVHNNDDTDIDFRLEAGALGITADGENDSTGFTVPAGESLALDSSVGGLVLAAVPEELPAALPFSLTALVGGPASIEQQPITLAAPVLEEAPPETPLTFGIGWARAALATSAGYLPINNTADEDIEITAAVAPTVEAVELHETEVEDGVMSMRPIERFVVPAEGTLLLQPGGLHLMLIGLENPLEVGQTVLVTLRTADDVEIPLALPVLEEAPLGFPADDMGMMDMDAMGDMSGDDGMDMDEMSEDDEE